MVKSFQIHITTLSKLQGRWIIELIVYASNSQNKTNLELGGNKNVPLPAAALKIDEIKV